MSNMDLEGVIEDSINDLNTDPVVEDTSTVDESVETDNVSADEPVVDSSTDTEVAESEEGSTSSQVPAPGSEQAKQPEDEFAKRFGIPSKSVTGRENRIPYSRVKRIVGKAEKEAIDRVTKEVEAKYQPKITEYETKIAEYEPLAETGRTLTKLIDDSPKEFFAVLQRHPAYKSFFEYLDANLPKGGPNATGVTNQPAGPAPGADDPMPQPEKKLADGSMVYDMDGLQKLLEWQSRQTESRVTQKVTKEFSDKYDPIRKDWETQQKVAEASAKVEGELAEARKWPNFEELETEIAQLLESDGRLSLEGAYRVAYHKTILPKIQAANNPDEIRAKTRAEVIAEMKAKGSSPSVRSTQTTPKPVPGQGVRSLEDVIAEQVEKIR